MNHTATALLLLDLQRDFLEANGKMPVGVETAAQVVSLANRLVKHAESVGWELIFIRNEFPRTEWLGNLVRNGAAIKGSPGSEIDPRVTIPSTSFVFTKSKSDAFSNPAIEEALVSAGIDQVVVLGVMAEGCVRATAKSAISRGFRVTIVSDAIGSSRGFLWRLGIWSMKNAGAFIQSSSQILNAS